MNLEAKKLSLIERFMKLNQESSLLQLEAVVTEIEMNIRADASQDDVKKGNTHSFDNFSKDVKLWVKTKTIN